MHRAALGDSLYVGLGAGLEVTFSGLNDSNTYSLVGYGAGPQSSVGQPWTLVTGTSPSPTTQTFPTLNNSTTVAEWDSIQSSGGVIMFSIIDQGSTSGTAGSISRLNFLSLTETVGTTTPEPSTLVLTVCGLLGLLAYAWRRRK